MSSVDSISFNPASADEVTDLLHHAWQILYAASVHVNKDRDAFGLLLKKRIQINSIASFVTSLSKLGADDKAVS